MSWLQLLELARRLGPKLKQEWPYLLHAYQDLQHVFLALNSNKPLMGATQPPKKEVLELTNLLEKAGVDTGKVPALAAMAADVEAGVGTLA